MQRGDKSTDHSRPGGGVPPGPGNEQSAQESLAALDHFGSLRLLYNLDNPAAALPSCYLPVSDRRLLAANGARPGHPEDTTAEVRLGFQVIEQQAGVTDQGARFETV